MKKQLLLALFVGLSGWVSAQILNTGTYNIRYINPNDSIEGNGWFQRCPVICDQIKFHDFDVLGTNEGYLRQLEDMQKLLPTYAYFGTGRNDGIHKGEHCAIFYKKAKYKLVENGHFFLSETPEKPGKAWDAKNPRLCTWGKFKDLQNGKIFYYFCVHFDHIGKIARVESAKMMVRQVQNIAGKYPAIVAGDMNFKQQTEGYDTFVNSGIFKDAFEAAESRYAQNGTFNNFRFNVKSAGRIDHMMISKSWKVKKYAIINDVYWIPVDTEGKPVLADSLKMNVKENSYQVRFPSDHFPIALQLEF